MAFFHRWRTSAESLLALSNFNPLPLVTVAMGNLLFQDDPYSIPEISAMRPTFEALQLRRGDIRQLLELYNKIDLDHDGSIMLDELMNHLNEGNIQFKSRIFSIFDENSSKTIDFREFVLSMWNYCTLSRATLGIASNNAF